MDDLFDGMDEDELKKLLPQVTEAEYIDAFLEGKMDLVQDVIHELKLYGFIVQVSTPVVRESGSYSWSLTHGAAFYADTYEDALQAGVTWAETVHKERV